MSETLGKRSVDLLFPRSPSGLGMLVRSVLHLNLIGFGMLFFKSLKEIPGDSLGSILVIFLAVLGLFAMGAYLLLCIAWVAALFME